ncbi:nucleotide disphospho-sugar-binding domain-containing protein [Antarcticimicrobium luteum]|uniref:Glycosyl transferase family 1 n=1 Tax=Antarcticimicrobium luteum TaxID=2547397 RepID=A0A4R5VGJ1_9RHOB|nr:glycosyltransferase [Antarcticimicrobium luteum]TDK52394.1 glycosyl transferase family 1 [Antarcticimicrobium luteum]
MNRPPTIALFPEASFGAALNCVGIAQELRRLGATPVFICHPGFTGVFAEYGFKEFHLPAQAQSTSQAIEDYWQSFINTQLPHFDLDPMDQLPTYVAPTWEAIVDTVEAAEPGLTDILNRIQPDLILLDNVIMFPAIANAGCPWVRIVSCAETELPDPNVPPYLSGLPPEQTGARGAFEKAYLRHTRASHARYNAFRKSRGLPPLPRGLFLEPSETLNLILAPSAVRYDRAEPLPADRFVFLEGCVRAETRFDPPPMPVEDGPLIYMSFGSLGAIDTGLIKRMIDVFATLPARFLINVGGFLEAYDQVPDNVYLGSWFPQPSVVPQAALFIHHGGNNSYCEALYHGVPSLVMPYCWDGHDNAQRAEATRTGRWMHRADWTPEDLRATILSLLDDDAMAAHLAGISRQMKAHPGTTRAAEACLAALRAPAVSRDRDPPATR